MVVVCVALDRLPENTFHCNRMRKFLITENRQTWNLRKHKWGFFIIRLNYPQWFLLNVRHLYLFSYFRFNVYLYTQTRLGVCQSLWFVCESILPSCVCSARRPLTLCFCVVSVTVFSDIPPCVTCNLAEAETSPKAFLAVHVYTPASLGPTAWIWSQPVSSNRRGRPRACNYTQTPLHITQNSECVFNVKLREVICVHVNMCFQLHVEQCVRK